MINQLKKNAVEWNKRTNDKDRFQYLMKHKGIFTLMLDNDYTFVNYNEKVLESVGLDSYDAEEILPELNSFDDYLGWSGGVKILLDVIGIPAEEV